MRAKQPEIFQLGNEVGFTKIDSVQAMRLYACNGKILIVFKKIDKKILIDN